MADPALSVGRARKYWQQHGRSEKWILFQRSFYEMPYKYIAIEAI
jgi:hypothetical protein